MKKNTGIVLSDSKSAVQSVYTRDYGYSFVSNHHKIPFFSMFFEPENGFGNAVKYDEKCREFLEAMSI